MIVVADTSGIIAASDRNSAEAADCQSVLREAGTVVISPLVLAEVDHMAKARFGPAARAHLIAFILAQARRLRFQVPEVDTAVLGTAQAVQQRYHGLDLDLADAVNVALAAEYRTDAVLTLDRRDFRAVRPLTPHKAFRLLPDDW
ncbi:type II toxin-antitoxin system VapC family toxin [Marinitenerispora sediminis]|uniref:VapC toxin family PIN domain ribonuclease n=1 Tax=Marinitenerispora sediminis TaxID=1931232 RepID=A0A368SZL9_9ACTN|nr:PIN domain-containing protein [Marinitenerispora sediminis]RCV51489.1 VapC toxin family PIN domain ribonuclease [Marinitenerispora sediminis]RCV52284.1 VapC toxin family PIN domain ribonuclease [Marinitenerispora sediminis]RCV58824.1 VapC toxin family PIN domain ribonuclease [Marinitenerispora sediminis]